MQRTLIAVNDVVAPRGDHPVAAPHGCELFDLAVMAGAHRSCAFGNDPVRERRLAPAGT